MMMTDQVYWVLNLEVREGKFDELTVLMKEMSDATKANEPGTLNYEWTVSDDRRRVTILERYSDSAAAIVHLGSFMKNFAPRFMACLEPKSLVTHGNASPELRKMLDGMGSKYMAPFGGFSR
jgi:quinol monooxygenase YgiN